MTKGRMKLWRDSNCEPVSKKIRYNLFIFILFLYLCTLLNRMLKVNIRDL